MSTEFDLDNLNPGHKFTFGDPKDETWVSIRICAGDDYRIIQKECSKKKAEIITSGVRPQRLTYDDIDEDKLNEMIWDFCIVDWGGFVDKFGNPVPCTRENKKKLMGGSVKFAAFVAKKLDELRKIEEAIGEDDEKN